MDWTTDSRFAGYSGARVLITGGAGFIGSHLAHALDVLGARVTVLDDLSGGYRENLPSGARLVEGSILDDGALAQAADGAELVWHQAAMVSVPESVENPDECARVNLVGTQRVVSAAQSAGARRVLFAASAAAYGNEPSLPSRESDLPDAWSPYAASKIAGELLMQSAARCHGIDTVSLRYFNIFGPRQDPASPYAAVITAFASRLIKGVQPSVFGDGGQTRDFTHIDNVVLANLLAGIRAEPLCGAIVNIGTGVRTDLVKVLNDMGAALDMEVTPTFGPDRPGDVRDSVADITRARELLGYEPVVDFPTGIAQTLEWFKTTA